MKQFETIEEYMNSEASQTGFPKVRFDTIHNIRHTKSRYAVGVWTNKSEISADPEGVQREMILGDMHAHSYLKRYNTPFQMAESLIFIMELDKSGEPQKGAKWVYAVSNSAYEYEVDHQKQEKEANTAIYFEGISEGEHSFGVGKFVDVTDIVALTAWIEREEKGKESALRYDKRMVVGEQPEEKEARLTKLRKELGVFVAACEGVMSGEDKKRWKKVKHIGELRKLVTEKRNTLMQKIKKHKKVFQKSYSVSR